MNTTVHIRRSIAMVTLALAVLIGGSVAWTMASGTHSVLGAARDVTLKVAPADAPAPAVNLTTGFSAIVEPLLPAVVNVSSSKMVNTSDRSGMPNDPFFRQFFGNQFGPGQDSPRQEREHSLGSGVVVSPDGYILTNNHVIDGATDIEVTLKDKRELKAQLIGADPHTDIAVLKIPATGLATVTLGDSTRMKVGDIVLAVGDPFNVGETVTMGIVSATNRRNGLEDYSDFIQTDAAINEGNSGGALVNTRGELIGINTAIVTNGTSEGNLGIGFAIPINMARHVMEEILKNGKVSRGYLGVLIQPVTSQLQKAFNLSSTEGALVGDVTPDSPGAKAGLQKGDVITAVDGQAVGDADDLRLRISQTAPGTTVKLDVFRDGQKRQVSLTLGEFPEEKTQASATQPEGNSSAALEGVQVDDLTPQIAQQLNLKAGTTGVVITNVDPNGNAAEQGLERGDVIQEVNHKPIADVAAFRAAVRAANGQPLLLLVNRGGNTRFVVLASQQQ